ncbi:hypothetical protein [Kineosporia mesophila]|uniref:hypothetical protein n=1 Tax=Kineosporia mesophila TaxID=566012 RepID=UPI001E33B958|nr:hypothetical protein [Kineosporia mesophila]MCD5353915.1 hypothetical protein [Kineosporia mesophila]
MPAQQEWIDAEPGNSPARTSHDHPFTRPALFVIVLVAIALIAGVVGVRRLTPDPVPTYPAQADQNGSSTCTDPSANQQWRVSWTVSDRTGVLPTAMAVRTLPDGAWTDRGADQWQLRWNQAPAEVAGTDFAWDHSLTAPLSGLSQVAISASLSPRFVTPDGACTVYAAAYGPGAAGRGSVAVVGDSLIAQLIPSNGTEFGSSGATVSPIPGEPTESPSPSSTSTAQATVGTAGSGPLVSRLTSEGLRPQVDGQGGRRWVVAQETSDALDLANGTMLDELRGLREAGTVVVALGTNDSTYASLAPNDAQFEVRLSWTLSKLQATLDEMAQHGHCTVLVSMASQGKRYAGTPRGNRFELAAARINAVLRSNAESQPRLAFYDWGTQADQHALGTADAWFGADTIHLSPAGIPIYVKALGDAADLGCG